MGVGDKAPEFRHDFRMLQPHGNGRFQITDFRTAIETLSFKMVGTDIFFFDQLRDAVCQLNLSSRTLADFFKAIENTGIEYITAHHGQC